MKKLVLLTTLIVFGFCAPIERYSYTGVQEMELRQSEQVFKAGFEAGIKSLDFQRKNDGFKPKRVNINKAYFITYEITKMPYEEALFLQNIAAREGFDTYITKKYIFFGEFEREADAVKAVNDLNSKFRIKAQLHKNNGGEYLTTYPKLWGQYFTLFEQEIKNLGYIRADECANTDNNKSNKSLVANSNTQTTTASSGTSRVYTTKVKTSFFTLKNSKAMSYMNYDKNNNSRHNSLEYIESGLKLKKRYPIGNFKRPYLTIQGESFYKVLNQNIYFSDKDVLIEE